MIECKTPIQAGAREEASSCSLTLWIACPLEGNRLRSQGIDSQPSFLASYSWLEGVERRMDSDS